MIERIRDTLVEHKRLTAFSVAVLSLVGVDAVLNRTSEAPAPRTAQVLTADCGNPSPDGTQYIEHKVGPSDNLRSLLFLIDGVNYTTGMTDVAPDDVRKIPLEDTPFGKAVTRDILRRNDHRSLDEMDRGVELSVNDLVQLNNIVKLPVHCSAVHLAAQEAAMTTLSLAKQ